jgi:hypothetical protein
MRTVPVVLGMAASVLAMQTAVAQGGAGSKQDSTARLVPAGYGTLKEDEFTVALRSGPLLIKVTPLNEAVIRAAAPDTYNRLHRMAESRQSEALRRAGATAAVELFKVTFYSYEPDVEYQPEGLLVTHQGRQLRPAAILPLTPAFGQQRLAQQANQMALYVFVAPFDYLLPITVRYNLDPPSDAWSGVVDKLEVERAKILARVKM